MSLAARYHWTPDQINAMPAQFIEELFEYIEAESVIQKRENDKAEKAARDARAASFR